MYKYTSQKNEKDSKAENKVNNRDKSIFPSIILFVKKHMIGKIHEQITNEHFSSLTDENQKKGQNVYDKIE